MLFVTLGAAVGFSIFFLGSKLLTPFLLTTLTHFPLYGFHHPMVVLPFLVQNIPSLMLLLILAIYERKVSKYQNLEN